MSSQTLRPTSTIQLGSGSVTGGLSAHAVLSDDSDSSYVDINGNLYNATVLAYTLPSLGGATVTAALTYAKARTTDSPGPPFFANLDSSTVCGAGYGYGRTTVYNSAALVSIASAYGDGSALQNGFWGAYIRLYETYLILFYIDVPTVNALGPTGTLTETNRPTITWEAEFDEDSTGLADYQVRVFTDAVYGGGGFNAATSTAAWETGMAADPAGSAGSVLVTTSLPNDTYRAYVRVKDSVSGWSAWDYSEFTVNVSPPDPPGISLSSDAANGRVAIAVSPDNSPIDTDGILIEHSLDGGTTWEAVAEDAGGSNRTLYDYFVPSGQSVSYRVAGWNDTASDRLYSTFTTGSITPSLGYWIKHPTDPSLNFKIDDRPNVYLRNFDSITRAARQTVNQPLGRSDVVVITDTYGAETGDLVVLISTQANLDDLNAILETAASLYLTGPGGGVGRDRWVVFGDLSASRLIDKKVASPFDVTLPWTEVARPEDA